MKTTSPYIQLSAIALTGLLASCSSSSPNVARVPVSISKGNDNSLNGRIFEGVNSYRQSLGKSSLKRHAGLDSIAQKHCEYLAEHCGASGTNIGHIGFEGRALVARFSYDIPSLGENVASSTTRTPERLISLWKSSKSHESNMRSDWVYTGVGTAFTADGMVISTQVFGTATRSNMGSSANATNRAW